MRPALAHLGARATPVPAGGSLARPEVCKPAATTRRRRWQQAPPPPSPAAAGWACRSPAALRCRRLAPSAASVEVASVDDPATAFDWRLGLALAGCAFEAYNDVEAEGETPGMKMTCMGGTEITFVDKDFLHEKFAGMMEVTVHGAKGLARADWFPGTKGDPYAVVNIGDSAGATSVVKNCLDPEWGEKLYLFVSDPSKQRLTVRVLDEDLGKADDMMGSTMRGLEDLVDGQSHDLELPLRGQGAAGTVSLSLRFLPFDDVLAEEAASSTMGGPVLGSPPVAIMGSEWRTLQREVLESAADAMFAPVAYIDNPNSDTQAWVFWNPATRSVCMAFRGTEQVKVKDIITDLRLVPASLDPEGVSEPPFFMRRRPTTGEDVPSLGKAVAALQEKREEMRAQVISGLQGILKQAETKAAEAVSTAAAAATGGRLGGGDAAKAGSAGQQAEGKGDGDEEDEEEIWVHVGFLEAYASVRPVVLRLLDTVLAGETEPWTLYITGHSLGGALSTLCTYDCARRRWRTTAHPPRIVHYNYGSPRVGNRLFAQKFDKLVPNAWRVVNSNDAVTLVPRMLGYCHIGHKVELLPEGEMVLTRHSSRGLAEGAEMADIALAAAVNLPALAEQLLNADDEQQQPDGSGAAGTALVEAGAAASEAAAANPLLQPAMDSAKPALLSAAAAVASAASKLAGLEEEAAAAAGSARGAEAAAKVARTAEDVQRLLEDEIEAMQRLLDGSALNEHLEPLYLENLRQAIQKLSQERQQ